MVMYGEEIYKILRKKLRVGALCMAFVALAAIGLCIGLAFAATPQNAGWMTAAASAALILAGWFCIALIGVFIMPYRAKLSHIEELFYTEKTLICGKVNVTGNSVTLSKGIAAEEIIICGDEERVLYWEKSLGAVPFNTGDNLCVHAADNYIFSWQANDER